MGRGGLCFSLSVIVSELWCHQWRHNEQCRLHPGPWTNSVRAVIIILHISLSNDNIADIIVVSVTVIDGNKADISIVHISLSDDNNADIIVVSVTVIDDNKADIVVVRWYSSAHSCTLRSRWCYSYPHWSTLQCQWNQQGYCLLRLILILFSPFAFFSGVSGCTGSTIESVFSSDWRLWSARENDSVCI